MTPEIVITEPIPGGTRQTVFALDGADLVPVRVVDDFGPHRGSTTYGPEWASEEARREAEEQVAEAAVVDVTEMRRKRAR